MEGEERIFVENPPNTFEKGARIEFGGKSLRSEESLSDTPDVRVEKRRRATLTQEKVPTGSSSIIEKKSPLETGESPEKKKTRGGKGEVTPPKLSPTSKREESSSETSPSSDVRMVKAPRTPRTILVELINYKSFEICFKQANELQIEPGRLNPNVIALGKIPADYFRPTRVERQFALILDTIERHVISEKEVRYRRDSIIVYIFSNFDPETFDIGTLKPDTDAFPPREDKKPVIGRKERPTRMGPNEFEKCNRDVTSLLFYYGPETEILLKIFTYIPADTDIKFSRAIGSTNVLRVSRYTYPLNYTESAERFWDPAVYLNIPLSTIHNEMADTKNVFATFCIDISHFDKEIKQHFSPRFSKPNNSIILFFVKKDDIYNHLYKGDYSKIRAFGLAKEDQEYEMKNWATQYGGEVIKFHTLIPQVYKEIPEGRKMTPEGIEVIIPKQKKELMTRKDV